MSVSIKIDNIVKRFDNATIIPGLSLQVQAGEFFTLLGPSGCGKTTLLRMIAGFNSIEGGTISFGDRIINTVPAHERNIGMVFQNYAIFPHLSVRANVEYGLKLRKLPKEEIRRRTDSILGLVKIEKFQQRLPEKLSGGQQQRVALARAIVIEPTLLLMDEPLSNLDAKLRLEMRIVIREIQKSVGITTVYVTHDQEEALAISDRIAVMNNGIIQQVGTPEQIYSRPANRFVASFIGHSNFVPATIRLEKSGCFVEFANAYKVAMDNLVPEVVDGQAVLVGVRPEEFVHGTEGLPMKIVERIYLGRQLTYIITPVDTGAAEPASAAGPGLNLPADIEDQAAEPPMEMTTEAGGAFDGLQPGSIVTLGLDARRVNVFSADGSVSLIKGADR